MRMTLKAIAILTATYLTVTVAIATTQTPSDRQFHIMKSAYAIAKQDGLDDPAILQGIVMTESTAGLASSKIHNGSVGVSQVLVGTARYVLHLTPNLIDEYFPKGFTKQQLIQKLSDDDIFNLKIASAYLALLSRENKLNGDRLIAAYNRGPGAVPHNPSQLDYVKKVKRFMRSPLALSAKDAAGSNDEYTSIAENVIMK